MPEATEGQEAYRVHPVVASSTESLGEAYARAAEVGEITASVWDGQRVNIITRAGSSSSVGKTYSAISANSGTPKELEQALADASTGGGRVISAVWDGQNVNLIVEE